MAEFGPEGYWDVGPQNIIHNAHAPVEGIAPEIVIGRLERAIQYGQRGWELLQYARGMYQFLTQAMNEGTGGMNKRMMNIRREIEKLENFSNGIRKSTPTMAYRRMSRGRRPRMRRRRFARRSYGRKRTYKRKSYGRKTYKKRTYKRKSYRRRY